MEFFEAQIFTRRVYDYVDEDEYQALQLMLAQNPALGALMPGTAGFRKVRWADPHRGKGRRGGLRIIYYYFPGDDQIWFMTVYDKNEVDDLTPAQKRALKTAITAELRARELRRSRKPRRH